MFTVLIAEKEHIDAIRQENKLFFEPFLESKELAFCVWNPTEQNLSEAVPGLLDAVGRRKSWRAVIINNESVNSSKLRNPFDVVEHGILDSFAAPSQQPQSEVPLEQWESEWKEYYDTLFGKKEIVYRNALRLPLQKLTTWLCFRPEDYIHNEVQEKKDVDDWAMEMLGRDDEKPSVRLEWLEREQYKRELRLKEKLRRAFLNEKYLNVSYPAEVYCISPRSAENNYFDPDAYWNIRQDSQYSSFADRNMYFDRMRFLVFDMLPSTHRNFRSDYIRFLASVLIFVSNSVPSSALQARRLYRLETETEEKPLRTLVTSYDKKLANTYGVIENEMEEIRSKFPRELTDKEAEALFCASREIPVVLDDSCDMEKAFAGKEYGLFFDRPENERQKWSRDFATSKKEMTYMFKQQTRSVRKGVEQMHLSSDIPEGTTSRLTQLQIADIREYTDAEENRMVELLPRDVADTEFYTKQMTAASGKVKNVIRRRMTRRTTMVVGALCLGVFLLSFLPFLCLNAASMQAVVTAILLCGGSVGAMAVLLLVSLFFLRSSVRKAVKEYNDTIRGILNEIHSSLKQFSGYLSAMCNVRRGHAVQNYARKNQSAYAKSLRIRKKHQEDIRKRRAFLAENYRDYLEDGSFCDETMVRPYDYDFDQNREYPYPVPFLAGDARQIEFISNGNYVTVPSSYVTRILVRMEGIYEK